MTEPRRCTGTTAKGQPCKATPMQGRDVCKAHSGDANVGRRTKLTEDLQHTITSLLRNGNYVEVACQVAGIGTAAFYSWMERGEADLANGIATPFAEFASAVPRARAEGEAVLLNAVRQAGLGRVVQLADGSSQAVGGDWRALAWMLERTRPQRYGRQDAVEIAARRDEENGRRQDGELVEVPLDQERLGEVGSILEQIGVLGQEAGDDEDAGLAEAA